MEDPNQDTVTVTVLSASNLTPRGGLGSSHKPPHFEVALVTSFGAAIDIQRGPLGVDSNPQGTEVQWNGADVTFIVPANIVPFIMEAIVRVKIIRKRHLRYHCIAETSVSLSALLQAGSSNHPLLLHHNVEDPTPAATPSQSPGPGQLGEMWAETPRASGAPGGGLPLRKHGVVAGTICMIAKRKFTPATAASFHGALAVAAPAAPREVTVEEMFQARLNRQRTGEGDSFRVVPLHMAPRIDPLVELSNDELERRAYNAQGQEQANLDRRLFARERLRERHLIALDQRHLHYILYGTQHFTDPDSEMVLLEGQLTMRPDDFRAIDLSSRPVEGIAQLAYVSWQRRWFVVTKSRIMAFQTESCPSDQWKRRNGWFNGSDTLGRCPAMSPDCPGWHVRAHQHRDRPIIMAPLTKIMDVAPVPDVETQANPDPGANSARYALALVFKDGDRWVLRTSEPEVWITWTSVLLQLCERHAHVLDA